LHGNCNCAARWGQWKSYFDANSQRDVTDQMTKASQGDLWNWGKIPMNYEIDKSGKPIEEASTDDDNTWLEAINS